MLGYLKNALSVHICNVAKSKISWTFRKLPMGRKLFQLVTITYFQPLQFNQIFFLIWASFKIQKFYFSWLQKYSLKFTGKEFEFNVKKDSAPWWFLYICQGWFSYGSVVLAVCFGKALAKFLTSIILDVKPKLCNVTSRVLTYAYN